MESLGGPEESAGGADGGAGCCGCCCCCCCCYVLFSVSYDTTGTAFFMHVIVKLSKQLQKVQKSILGSADLSCSWLRYD